MARVKFWVCINAYGLLLDLLGLAALVVAWRAAPACLAASVLASLVGAYALYGGIGIHSTYGEKCRIYELLSRRNRKSLRVDTFADFMSVPCHRLVVRMVLRHGGYACAYKTIKRRFYVPPWRRRMPCGTELIVFRTKEDGDKWLARQRSMRA